MKDHLMEMIDNQPVSMFDYKKDKFLMTNVLDKNPDLRRQMEEKLKAIIQTYNTRLLENNMVVK
jgi:hypothetical protein